MLVDNWCFLEKDDPFSSKMPLYSNGFVHEIYKVPNTSVESGLRWNLGLSKTKWGQCTKIKGSSKGYESTKRNMYVEESGISIFDDDPQPTSSSFWDATKLLNLEIALFCQGSLKLCANNICTLLYGFECDMLKYG